MSIITYEQIKAVSDGIVTTNIKGKEYAAVNGRINAFRRLYPQGFISTEILSMDAGVVVMKATCGYYENGQSVVLGTGMAYEREGSSNINKTSYIENCETSAVGRALGMAGIGVTTAVASSEEVQNASLQQEELENDVDPQKRVALIDEINAMMKDYDQDTKRTLFAQALQEAGLSKNTSGVMTVSELQRAKFAMRTVIARFEA
jgi:hypothetical protein